MQATYFFDENLLTHWVRDGGADLEQRTLQNPLRLLSFVWQNQGLSGCGFSFNSNLGVQGPGIQLYY